MQTFAPVEVDILSRVDQIETGDPTDHAGSENERRQIEPASFSDPRTRGSDPECEAEEKVGRPREAFCQRVKEYDSESHRRERGSHAIDDGAGDEEIGRASCRERVWIT